MVLNRIGRRGWLGIAVALVVVLGIVWFVLNPRSATIRFEEGMVFDYMFDVTETTSGNRARFIVTEIKDGGHTVAFRGPEITGVQSVSLAARVAGRCLVETLYNGDNTAEGCFSYVRVSDALYRDLKLGRWAEYRQEGEGITGPVRREYRPFLITAYRDDRPVKVRVMSAVNRTRDDGILVHDDPDSPFAIFSLINIWTPASLSREIERDLSRKRRATTTAILFRSDGSIDDSSDPVLAAVADWMTDNPNTRLKIVVHTQTRGSTPDAQLTLSQQRAATIVQTLTARNLEPGRLAAEGRGGSQPTEWGGPRDERVEFVVERGRGP